VGHISVFKYCYDTVICNTTKQPIIDYHCTSFNLMNIPVCQKDKYHFRHKITYRYFQLLTSKLTLLGRLHPIIHYPFPSSFCLTLQVNKLNTFLLIFPIILYVNNINRQVSVSKNQFLRACLLPGLRCSLIVKYGHNKIEFLRLRVTQSPSIYMFFLPISHTIQTITLVCMLVCFSERESWLCVCV